MMFFLMLHCSWWWWWWWCCWCCCCWWCRWLLPHFHRIQSKCKGRRANTAQVERKWTQDIRAFKNYIYRHLSSIFYALHTSREGNRNRNSANCCKNTKHDAGKKWSRKTIWFSCRQILNAFALSLFLSLSLWANVQWDTTSTTESTRATRKLAAAALLGVEAIAKGATATGAGCGREL